jgi:hypothetical protein
VDFEDAMRQTRGQLQLPFASSGESAVAEGSGEAWSAVRETERSGSDDPRLMERVVERSNVLKALKRVQKNKGGPGIDGMTVEGLREHLRETWPVLREQLLAGTYRPQQVKRQLIPKSGGGMRELGIPTSPTDSFSRRYCRSCSRNSIRAFHRTATASDLGGARTMRCARRRHTSRKVAIGWWTWISRSFSTA